MPKILAISRNPDLFNNQSGRGVLSDFCSSCQSSTYVPTPPCSIEGAVTTCVGKAIVASDRTTQIGPFAVSTSKRYPYLQTPSHETPAINLLPQNPQHHRHATTPIMFLNIALLYRTIDIAPPTTLYSNPFTVLSLLCIPPRR